jgi:hypothetical protein
MNVFVLGTGRCGTATFIAACRHFSNYTAGHETLSRKVGAARLAYPPNHIEADNRLSWLLGRLDAAFGQDAFYVHLRRDPEAVAVSYATRWQEGIGTLPAAYHRGILHQSPEDRLAICRDLVATVTANVESFLRDKPHQMTIRIESIHEMFPVFCQAIGAEGDLEAAGAEWDTRHNATPQGSWVLRRVRRKLGRIVRRVGLRY